MANNLGISTFYQSYFKDPISRVKEIGLKGLDKTKSVFFRSLNTYLVCHDVILGGIESRIFTKRTKTLTAFLPTAAILGLGFLTIPSCRIEIILPELIKNWVFLSLFAVFINIAENKNQNTSNYEKAWDSTHPFHISVTGPVLEELEFRGVLQNLILLAGGGSVPAILISAILFGLVHLGNDHDLAKYQVMSSVFAGVLFGIENEYYGIFAPIAHHITNNYITELLLYFYGK